MIECSDKESTNIGKNNSDVIDERDVIRLNRYDISVNLMQPTIETWVSYIDKKYISIPPFQRNFRWKITKASKLVETFLLGLPVPPIFLYDVTEKKPSFRLIDGQQRLLSLFFFIKNIFPKEGVPIFDGNKPIIDVISSLKNENRLQEFVLTGVDDRWNDLTFGALDEDDQMWLQTRPLWAIAFRQIKPDPDNEKLNSIFYVFERLNTGGEILNSMEMRKALFFGDFALLLEELNKNQYWRKIYGKTTEHEKLIDIELILRFFALQEWTIYNEPMKEFLNSFMRNKINVSSEDIERSKDLFLKTCELIYDSVGEKPFHIFGPLNTAMMDSFMVLTSKHVSNLTQDKLKNIYESSKGNDEFKERLQARVNVGEVVLKERFTLLSSIFEKYV
ncbi:MAG: DUF262 domain-containing protein [Candidatus Magnetoovum sp. WYHC-5]|nr:DUF262 domain-containing protein [Candidatus Magnetoovum sp. WYHC-5]